MLIESSRSVDRITKLGLEFPLTPANGSCSGNHPRRVTRTVCDVSMTTKSHVRMRISEAAGYLIILVPKYLSISSAPNPPNHPQPLLPRSPLASSKAATSFALDPSHLSRLSTMPSAVSNATRIWEVNIHWDLYSQCGIWDQKGKGVDIWECIRARQSQPIICPFLLNPHRFASHRRSFYRYNSTTKHYLLEICGSTIDR